MLTVDGRIIFLSSIRKYVLKYIHEAMQQWNSCCTYHVSYIPLQFLYCFLTTSRHLPEEPFNLWFIKIQIILIYFQIFKYFHLFFDCQRMKIKPNKNLQRDMVVCQISSVKILIWLVAGSKILVNSRIRPLYYLF